METQVRYKTIQDQENQHIGKQKNVLPIKRQGLAVRGVLGEIDGNVQIQRDVNKKDIAKKPPIAIEALKKVTSKNNSTKINYKHVQSKIDTGLAKTISARPPLKREESTASHAVRAAVKSKLATLKKNDQVIETRCEFDTQKPSGKAKIENEAINTQIDSSKEEPFCFNKLSLDTSDSVNESVELPEGIEDVDVNDRGCPMNLTQYIKDIYQYLTKLEIKYPIFKNHLKDQAMVTGNMRATLIDWLVEVQGQFSLFLETLQLAIGIVDRYLQVTPTVHKTQLQLVGVTAMFIASKYEEIYPPAAKDFLYITNNTYTKEDLFQCEREILTKLQFCLARPIPLQFLRRYTKVAGGHTRNHHLAKYLVDLSLVEYSLAHCRPSQLAAAAACLSLYLLSDNSLKDTWTPTLQFYSKYYLADLLPVMTQMARLVLSIENSKHQSVYRKYTKSNVAKVATLPQLRGSMLKALANISQESL